MNGQRSLNMQSRSADDPTKASCRICRFYHGANGWCKRYPPTIVQLPSGAMVSYYPVVQTDGWCGEFRPHNDHTRPRAVRKDGLT